MTMQPLPKLIDPIRLAKKQTHITGIVSLNDLPRIVGMSIEGDGAVEVDLSLAVDDRFIPFIQGRLTANLNLTCQRCMQPMRYEVCHTFCLSPVESDAQCEKLPERYEGIQMEKGMLSLFTLVEDELLLCVPIVAKHEKSECCIIDSE